MISNQEILETIAMIQNQNLDIRTITMGISLVDCMDGDIEKSRDKIYEKICRKGGRLVESGEYLAKKYGIPIINKRVAVTPLSILLGVSGGDPLRYAEILDRAAKEIGIDFIGGFSALVQKGFAPGDRALIEAIPEALAATEKVCASVNIGSTRAGINLDAVRLMGKIILEAATRTQHKECMGAGKLVVFCNAVEDNPFMAGAFHGIGENDTAINVGVSGPGVVREAIRRAPPRANISEIADIIKKTAFKITRVGQLIGYEAGKLLGVPFGIVDLSLAPTPAVGDSVAHIIEEMGVESCGGYGTTAALAILNDAVKKGGVMASSRVGGLSGAFIPVSEDAGMIAAVERGSLKIEKLEAMTAVCSVGLDMIVVPGDTSPDILAGIIADEAAIGMVNSKTTAVRIIPAVGKKDGEGVNFGGLFGYGPVMEVNRFSPARFLARGGQIPAPIQSLKN
ncbi:MAG: PFL family protein [Fusobacteriaceae bacterium]|jgi:uncharacterized protein (UPF0210 family)|nr:PFL family protein [Fusobacteriaceae bacterium]